MLAGKFHDGASWPALLDGDLFERALEDFLMRLRCIGGCRAILSQQHELAGPQRDAAIPSDGLDDVRPAQRNAADKLSGVDVDACAGFLHADEAGGLRGVSPGDYFERPRLQIRAGSECMRGPFERAVGPVGEGPAL
jgi:hypothetical protein